MTRIKDATFETGNITGTDAFESTVGTPTPTVDTTSAIKGVNAASISNTATDYGRVTYTGVDTVYVSMYIKLSALPASSVGRILRIADTANATLCSIYVSNTGSLTLRNSANSTVGSAWGTTIATGTIYRIGLRYTKGTGANGTIEGFAVAGDGNFGSAFASNTAYTTTTQAGRVEAGNTTTNPATFLLDDLRIDDTAMPGPSGGANTNKTLTVTVTTVDTIVKAVGIIRTLSDSITVSLTSNNTYSKVLSVAIGTTESITKAIGKTISASKNIAATISKNVAKTISLVETITPSMVKGFGYFKTLTATSIISPNITKNIGKLITSSITEVISMARNISKIIPRTITTISSIAKGLSKTITVVKNISATMVKGFGYFKTLTATSNISLQTTKNIMKSFLRTNTIISSIQKSITLSFSVIQPISVILSKGRAYIMTLSTSVHTIASIIHDFISGGGFGNLPSYINRNVNTIVTKVEDVNTLAIKAKDITASNVKRTFVAAINFVSKNVKTIQIRDKDT